MPTEPVTIPQSKHPVHAMTTYELRDYRRELVRWPRTFTGSADILR